MNIFEQSFKRSVDTKNKCQSEGFSSLIKMGEGISNSIKNERANALKEVKRLCKEFGFTAGMLKGSLAEGRKTK